MGETSPLPWIVEFRTSRAPGAIKLHIKDKAVIGRADRTLGISPDLDLTPFGAAELDVALEHVGVYTEDDHLNIVDLGNGSTRLNGTLLEAHSVHRLDHEDDLQLGNLHFHVHIIASPTKSGMIHQQPHLQLAEESLPPGTGQPILIVEDDPPTAELLSRALKREGYTTHICHEVVSAIRALSSEVYSAILLDLMLPNIHGLELCRYVRRDIHQRDIPIVAVSAATTASSVKQALAAGVDVFIGKPFHIEELTRKVSALVHWYEAQRPSRDTKKLDGTSTAQKVLQDVDTSKRNALVLFVAGYQEPVAVVVQKRITIGRKSSSASTQPSIDLDRYGAFEAGVSRIHAAIHRKEDGFYLEDLGSSNGTWVNEIPLPPNELRLLQNASQIRLGSLRLRTFFFTEEEQEILHGKQDDGKQAATFEQWETIQDSTPDNGKQAATVEQRETIQDSTPDDGKQAATVERNEEIPDSKSEDSGQDIPLEQNPDQDTKDTI